MITKELVAIEMVENKSYGTGVADEIYQNVNARTKERAKLNIVSERK